MERKIPHPAVADAAVVFAMALVEVEPFEIGRAFRARRRQVRIVPENLEARCLPQDLAAIAQRDALAARGAPLARPEPMIWSP
jgi:hypothetical protein